MKMQDQRWEGAVVRALCGREAGRTFAVVGIAQDELLLLADGRHRRLESPKRKKCKHVERIGHLAPNGLRDDGETGMTNRELWRALAKFRDGEG